MSGWLHRTAVFKSRERRRSESRYRRRLEEYTRLQPDHGANLTPDNGMECLLEPLDGDLDQLPDADRRVIFLRYFEGLDAGGMAERLGISAEAAQKQCERARARLARKLAAAGTLTGGLLHAQFSTSAPAPVIAAAASALYDSRAAAGRPPLAFPGKGLAAAGAAAVLATAGWFVIVSGEKPEADTTPQAIPAERRAELQTTAGAGTPDAGSIPRPGPLGRHSPATLAEIAVLLERADEGDSTAAAEAEAALATYEPQALTAAAATLRELPLPVNQLRVLALGIVRHLVSRDPRMAVLAGEQLWRSQHGASTPVLAGLVNAALARWHRADPDSVAKWFASAAADGVFEDRGISLTTPDELTAKAFSHALDLARRTPDTAARVALALKWNAAPNSLPQWTTMTDVWAHQLTPAGSRELADALDACAEVSAEAAFQFRFALALLPVTAPDMDTLRRTATRAGSATMNPEQAAAVLNAWRLRDPAGTAAWMETLTGTPDGEIIAALPAATSLPTNIKKKPLHPYHECRSSTARPEFPPENSALQRRALDRRRTYRLRRSHLSLEPGKRTLYLHDELYPPHLWQRADGQRRLSCRGRKEVASALHRRIARPPQVCAFAIIHLTFAAESFRPGNRG